MKRFLRILAVLALAIPTAARAQGPEAQFVQIYKLIQQADTLAAGGQARTAAERYLEAQAALKQLQTAHAGWNEKVVKFRLNYVAEKLSALKEQLPPPQPGRTNRPPVEAEKPLTSPSAERELDFLNQQIRLLQSDKKLLEAKLKEALSAQPAAVDPRELKKAEERIRTLQKENELLKVSLQKDQSKPAHIPDASSTERIKKALAEANLRLQQQMAAAATLELEKKALEARLQTLSERPQPAPPRTADQLLTSPARPAAKPPEASSDVSSKIQEQAKRIKEMTLENQTLLKKLQNVSASSRLAPLQAENEKLKMQLEAAKQSPNLVAENEGLNAKLQSIKAELDAQKSANARLRSEKSTLERRLKETAAKPAVTMLSPRAQSQIPARMAPKENRKARDETERLKRLEKEKDDLQKKLNAANEELVKSQRAFKPPKDNRKEADRLAAHLAVLEARKVPYTAEELALFEPPSPKIAPPKESNTNPQTFVALELADNSKPNTPARSEAPPQSKTAPPPAPNGSKAGKKSLNDLPPGAGPLVAEAQRAFAAKRYDEAEQKYRQALRLDEKNVFLLANLATIELEQTRFSEAEATLKKALHEEPQDGFALSLLGILKFREEKFDEALEALSQAAKLDPLNPETQNYLGITLSQKGMRDAAETALRKAIQLAPGYPSAHYNLAVVYATQQPPFKELARLHYQKAIGAGHPRNSELEKLFAESNTSAESK